MPKNALLLRNPGMVFVVTFVALTVVNAIIIALANSFFSHNVVLGTMSVSVPWAVALASMGLALIDTLALSFLSEIEYARKKDLQLMEMMLAYFLINSVGLWLLARGADVLGMGLSSWVVVVVLAAVLDFVQGSVMVGLEKVRKG